MERLQSGPLQPGENGGAQKGLIRAFSLRLPSRRTLVVLLVLLTALTYFNTLFYDFVWDDKWLIPASSLIKQWSTLPALLTSDFWIVDQPSNYYRPLVSLSYFLEHQLWGLNPAGYHLTNLLLHLAVTLSLFWVCRLLFREPLLAFLAGLVFALHPVHTESVAFISGRTDLFAALFFLLGFGLYVRARAETRWGWPDAGALLAFALALLSKEVAVTFPLVLILYEVLFRTGPAGSSRVRVLLRQLPFWGVLAGYLLLRALILGTFLSRGVQLDSAYSRILTGVKALAAYLRLTVVPYPLNAQHMFFVPTTWLEPAFLASLGLVLVALTATLLAAHRSGRVAFAGLWFFVTLLPTASLLFGSGTMMAERFLYLPSVGFSVMAGIGLAGLLTPRVRPLAGVAIVLIFVSYMGLTMWRNEDWKDEYRLFSRTVEDSPLSTMAKVNLGYVHVHRGEYALAIREFHDALRLMPETPRALLGLGLASSMLGYGDDAVAYGERALAGEPGSAVIHANLGAIYSNAGAFDRAVNHFLEALRQHPQNPLIRYNLAAALANLGRYGEAKEEMETADRLTKLYLVNEQTRHRFRALVYERYDPRLAIMSWERYVTALNAISDPTPLQASEAQNARARLAWLKKNSLNGAQGQ